MLKSHISCISLLFYLQIISIYVNGEHHIVTEVDIMEKLHEVRPKVKIDPNDPEKRTYVCPKWHIMDKKNRFCINECPRYQFMTKAGICFKGCPEGWHMEYTGFCIEGCPPNHIIGKTGRCEFQDYSRHVNYKYTAIIAAVILTLVLVYAIYYIKKKYYDLLPYNEAQSNLAVSLAKINNLNEERASRQLVEIGIGTDPENINDWVNEIWLNYVQRDDQLLRKVEFSKFVKNIFRITQSQYVATDFQINNLFMMIKNMNEGKATRPGMAEFLKDLSRVQPPAHYYDESNNDIEQDADSPFKNPDVAGESKEKVFASGLYGGYATYKDRSASFVPKTKMKEMNMERIQKMKNDGFTT